MTHMLMKLKRPRRRYPKHAWASLPLRLIVGLGFLSHGYAKLVRGPETFVAIIHALGIPAPFWMAWITIILEIICGFAVLIGAFIPLVSIPMAAILLVATLTVHLPYGFSSIKLLAITDSGAQFGMPGYETDLLYLAALAALVINGAGPFSVHGMKTIWKFVRDAAASNEN